MNLVLEDIRKQFVNRSMLARLIIVNAGVFVLLVLVRVVVGLFLDDPSNLAWLEEKGYYFAVPAAPLSVLSRPWTIITHMFTHIEFWHLFWNMIWLYFMGSMLSDRLGDRKMLSTYLLGGISGFLAYFIIFNLFSALPTNGIALGASAAVMAVVTTVAAYRPNSKIMLFGVLPLPLWVLAVGFVLKDVMDLQSGNNIGGHLAHLGGAAFGFIQGRGLALGQDYFLKFEQFLDRFFNAIKPGPNSKMKVVRPKKKAPKNPRGKSDEEYNQEKYTKQEQVNRILDKISKSGYDSLSKFEKDFLSRQGD
ncbi:MAG: membrane associated rhomboid family serine protease [Flavobacteriales bacterium]|jgi:membrane associated rhomboid family serine protease